MGIEPSSKATRRQPEVALRDHLRWRQRAQTPPERRQEPRLGRPCAWHRLIGSGSAILEGWVPACRIPKPGRRRRRALLSVQSAASEAAISPNSRIARRALLTGLAGAPFLQPGIQSVAQALQLFCGCFCVRRPGERRCRGTGSAIARFSQIGSAQAAKWVLSMHFPCKAAPSTSDPGREAAAAASAGSGRSGTPYGPEPRARGSRPRGSSAARRSPHGRRHRRRGSNSRTGRSPRRACRS